MVHKTIYLAGPINGCSWNEATDWRAIVKGSLATDGIKCLSPLRAEIALKEASSLKDAYTREELEEKFNLYRQANVAMLHSRGLTTRDRFDCTHCSVLFVNLLGAKKVSIGSVMEIAWADANRIPSVIVMEPGGNCMDHAMINECTGFRVARLEDGIEIVRAILGDY